MTGATQRTFGQLSDEFFMTLSFRPLHLVRFSLYKPYRSVSEFSIFIPLVTVA